MRCTQNEVPRSSRLRAAKIAQTFCDAARRCATSFSRCHYNVAQCKKRGAGVRLRSSKGEERLSSAFSLNFRTTRWEEMPGRYFRLSPATSAPNECPLCAISGRSCWRIPRSSPQAGREAVFWWRVCEFADETSTLRRSCSSRFLRQLLCLADTSCEWWAEAQRGKLSPAGGGDTPLLRCPARAGSD